MSNPSLLSGRYALITGASRGIGAAAAESLADAGAHVILLARTQGALEEIDDRIKAKGGLCSLMPADLGKLDDLDKTGHMLAERFGRLDIFIGNAGMLGPLSPLQDVAPKDWEKVFKINFFANARLIRSVDALLRVSDAGRVVFTTTALTQNPLAYWGPYVASKTALNSFARTYAAETAKTNIRVNLLDPGIVDTDMLRQAFPGNFQGAVRKPEDIAQAFVNLSLPGCETHGEIVKA